jgi:hypothetical protein
MKEVRTTMRPFVLALVSLVAAVALAAASSSAAADPAPAPDPAIVSYDVQAHTPQTDPTTGLTWQGYTITISFTHQRGLIGVHANEYDAVSNEKLSLDDSVVRETRIGTDTLSVQVASLAGGTVYFKLYLFKPGILVGKPPGVTKGEVIYDTETTGTYSN